MNKCQLQVNHREFLEALEYLSKTVKAWTRQPAHLTYDEGHLIIGLNNVEASVRAEGEWKGSAQVAGNKLIWLGRALKEAQRKKMLATRDTMILRLTNSRVYFDNDFLPIVSKD